MYIDCMDIFFCGMICELLSYGFKGVGVLVDKEYGGVGLEGEIIFYWVVRYMVFV